ncbi:glycosyltransferase [Hamadaea tsunoensis]|uniref:glycosyltransferase n=1 Tax=Hamadaea tsunoensis TaxID=53368 RepID=UPI0004152CB9|nr:glycosyltransferase [Hamadaea tsunoensis]
MTEPLRILAVTNLWPEEGSYRGIFVERQVTAVRALGHQVDVEVVAQSRGKLDYVSAAPRVRARVKDGGYDLVHIHYGLAALAARGIGRTPRVLSLYGSDINAPKQRMATKLGWSGTAARIYVSQRLADTAGDPAGHVVANGVDFDLFTPGDRRAVRQEYDLPETDPVVLFGGDPKRPVKGYDVYADVLAELRRRGVPVRELVLSAPGQPATELVRKYDAADVLLFTSREGSEGSPTVVKEATAMGLPVVSVDVGDVTEVLRRVHPSAVVPFPKHEDPAHSRRQLVSTLADRTIDVLMQRVRADGRESCAWLDERRVAERIVEIYRKVLAG